MLNAKNRLRGSKQTGCGFAQGFAIVRRRRGPTFTQLVYRRRVVRDTLVPPPAMSVALCRSYATGQTCASYTDFRWLAKRYGARRDDVYLFTDMAVMIDGIARKAGSPP
jgi:hypothetical protein